MKAPDTGLWQLPAGILMLLYASVSCSSSPQLNRSTAYLEPCSSHIINTQSGTHVTAIERIRDFTVEGKHYSLASIEFEGGEWGNLGILQMKDRGGCVVLAMDTSFCTDPDWAAREYNLPREVILQAGLGEFQMTFGENYGQLERHLQRSDFAQEASELKTRLQVVVRNKSWTYP